MIMDAPNTKDKEAGLLGVEEGAGRGPAEGVRPRRTAEAIETWLVTRLSELLRTDPEQIDVRAPFVSYGLGSVEGITLAGELEHWLGYKLPATLVWDYPNVESLALHLAERQGHDSPAAAGFYKN